MKKSSETCQMFSHVLHTFFILSIVIFQGKSDGRKRMYIVETIKVSNNSPIGNDWKSSESRSSKDWKSNIGYEIDYLNQTELN